MLATDLRYEVVRSHVGDSRRLDDASLRDIFGGLEREAAGRLRGWFDGSIRLRRSAEMRYGEQAYEIDVGLDDLDWAADGVMARAVEHFHRRHRDLYTYDLPGEEVVFLNARAAAIGEVAPSPEEQRPDARAGDGLPRGKRRAFLGGWRDVPVFDLDALRAGQVVPGPAIVEAETTTVVANEGDTIAVNDLGWLDIALRASDRGEER
jgi:N-methylhydantoinase A